MRESFFLSLSIHRDTRCSVRNAVRWSYLSHRNRDDDLHEQRRRNVNTTRACAPTRSLARRTNQPYDPVPVLDLSSSNKLSRHRRRCATGITDERRPTYLVQCNPGPCADILTRTLSRTCVYQSLTIRGATTVPGVIAPRGRCGQTRRGAPKAVNPILGPMG